MNDDREEVKTQKGFVPATAFMVHCPGIMRTEIPDSLAETLRCARSVCVLTGAGVSAESGIPTFRDAREGLWAKYDPMELATPEGFARDPETVTRWYDWRRRRCLEAEPNPAHRALVQLQEALARQRRSFTLVTQNVDRLHQAAGSRDVIELHGTILAWRCTRCREEREEPGGSFDSYPPQCRCGGTRRPAVVWFGEMLPTAALARSYEEAGRCNLFFSVGTSAVVYPAAGLLQAARAGGAKTVEINKDPTPASARVDWSIRGKAGEILPELMRRAFG